MSNSSIIKGSTPTQMAIDDDLKWLASMPPSLEREHIEMTLRQVRDIPPLIISEVVAFCRSKESGSPVGLYPPALDTTSWVAIMTRR